MEVQLAQSLTRLREELDRDKHDVAVSPPGEKELEITQGLFGIDEALATLSRLMGPAKRR